MAIVLGRTIPRATWWNDASTCKYQHMLCVASDHASSTAPVLPRHDIARNKAGETDILETSIVKAVEASVTLHCTRPDKSSRKCTHASPSTLTRVRGTNALATVISNLYLVSNYPRCPTRGAYSRLSIRAPRNLG